ncbi:MAG: hypothetical protein ACOX37_06590 [Bacillota bacterium]
MVAIRTGDENRPEIKALGEALEFSGNQELYRRKVPGCCGPGILDV